MTPDGPRRVAVDEATIDRVFREESRRSVASLVRSLGDIDLAEEAVQDAFAAALRVWPERGLPVNAGAWITTTARNRALDRLRRDGRGRELLRLVAVAEAAETTDGAALPDAIRDDVLRLVFTCCHPALAVESRIALTLRLVAGIQTAEVARLFLVSESAMTQRLVRAKRKIREARIPFRVPEEDELPARVRSVLAVVYLIYTSGLTSDNGSALRSEGLRLARTVAELLGDEPEAWGLLALLLLTQARAATNRDAAGRLVLLADQDRAAWDHRLIREGHQLVRRCLDRAEPGPYQLQAAISAVHTDAPSAEETDWAQIVALYDQLLEVSPTPVVALNRAVAVAEVEGPGAALPLVDELDLGGYAPFHATRADLLSRLGRGEEAAAEYGLATAAATSEGERVFLAAGGRHRPSTHR